MASKRLADTLSRNGTIRQSGTTENSGYSKSGDDLIALLDLLDVWNWRSNYDSFDAGWMVEDGSTWTFDASIEGRSCESGGGNAYPSIRSISVPSIQPSRFGLLVAGLYDIFGIHAYIEQAQQVAARSALQADEPSDAPKSPVGREFET